MDYVLLHGTGQGPAGWRRLIDELEGRGHRAVAVDFPTDRPELLAEEYAAIAAEQAGPAVDEPVVVAHSGSGMLLPAVADALRARHLVWLAAAVPDFDGGASFAEQLRRSAAEIAGDEWRESGRLSTEDPVIAAYFGFHDCDLETLRWAVTTMRLFLPQAVYEQAPPPRPTAPSTFVVPRHDRTLRPGWFRAVARERLGVEPVEVDGGHFPHVSRPSEVAGILERRPAAGPGTTSPTESPISAGHVLEIGFATFTPRITIHPERRLTVEVIAGDNAGFSDTVEYEAVAIRDGLVILSWREHIGSTIVHVLDLTSSQAYTTVTSAGGEFMRLTGRIEVRAAT